jgi:hypothetical protein
LPGHRSSPHHPCCYQQIAAVKDIKTTTHLHYYVATLIQVAVLNMQLSIQKGVVLNGTTTLKDELPGGRTMFPTAL